MGSKNRNSFRVPDIMVFRPTMEEFKDFNSYVSYMESQGANLAGLAKVIPPPEWKPRSGTYDMSEIGHFKIPAPISQILNGVGGTYQQINLQKKPMTVSEYKELAESMKYCKYRPPLGDNEEVERAYWKHILYGEQIYGADVSGSLMDDDLKEWNINKLGSILDYVSEDYKINIEGVNTAYLYFGMWKTTFAWHTEDMDLYSINYLHFGEPKTWYAIPPSHGRRFERVAAGLFPDHFKSCKAFLRHKTSLLSPSILKAHSIPYQTITQEAGEIMITFPYSYHAGFNQGFNCAESTNFASKRWVEYGKRCLHCTCMKDSVKISMDVFVRRLQPERYDQWLLGKDIGEHPEVPGQKIPAPLPDGGFARRSPEKNADLVKKTSKRHPIHKRPASPSLSRSPESSTDSCEGEDLPDEQDLAYLEEIYIKGDPKDATILDDGHGMRHHLPGAKKPNSDEEAEWLPSSVKKSPKKKLKCRLAPEIKHLKSLYPKNSINPFPIQTTSGGRKPMLSATVFPSVNSPSRAASTTFYGSENSTTFYCNEAISRILGKDLTCMPVVSKSQAASPVPKRNFPYKSTKSGTTTPKPKSYYSLYSSQVQTSPIKPEDSTPPKNIGVDVLRDLINAAVLIDTDIEGLYNSYWSQSEPHCSLCTALCTRKSKMHDPMPDDWKKYNYESIPVYQSEIWSPAYVFSRKLKDHSSDQSFEFGTQINKSPLLTCEKCKVCVHASCYGEFRTVLPGQPWCCDKCRVHMSGASCCLCPIPWGPLKRTSDRRWAHLLCSLAIYEVNFMGEDREPINVHNINQDRQHFSCSYCKGSGRGVCVECCHPLCKVAFHPTCGMVCGARFSISKGPTAVHVLASCADHTPCPAKVATKVLKRPNIGDQVWARHPNGSFYSGTVECVDEKIFAWIAYADGSFSNETEPQFVSFGSYCRDKQLRSGLRVDVLSPQGVAYQGDYEGSSLALVYTVRTESLLITGVRDSDLIEFGKSEPALVEEQVKQEVPEEATISSTTS
ncbi:probable lysine-specific demethylase 4B isoform X2 [Neocloeon triangulifer]|uniref:probable lysine-specific demethylase 4B isoform X2 n=1 Tax=Neocloeon triangulifer TaxID=2078957 RepID=UPI00286F3AD4|nr:probable lysine-specific demethylase 4B isoform X2 [Neocloeon triangulifer]